MYVALLFKVLSLVTNLKDYIQIFYFKQQRNVLQVISQGIPYFKGPQWENELFVIFGINITDDEKILSMFHVNYS